MSTTDPAPERSFDENVAAVVRVLLAAHALDAVDLAPRVGMTKSTMYNRLSGKPWLAAEIDRIAAYFNTSPANFYRPVELLVEGQKFSLKTATDLQPIDGGRDTSAPVRGHLSPV